MLCNYSFTTCTRPKEGWGFLHTDMHVMYTSTQVEKENSCTTRHMWSIRCRARARILLGYSIYTRIKSSGLGWQDQNRKPEQTEDHHTVVMIIIQLYTDHRPSCWHGNPILDETVKDNMTCHLLAGTGAVGEIPGCIFDFLIFAYFSPLTADRQRKLASQNESRVGARCRRKFSNVLFRTHKIFR